jgi:hypothetical protein
MSEPNLEQVKRLTEQLSPDDRRLLWSFLSSLPDSGIQNLNEPPPTSGEAAKHSGTTTDGDYYELLYTPTNTTILLKGRVIFQVFFNPDNFQQSRMEIRSWKDEPPTERDKEQMREFFRLNGSREPTEEEMTAAYMRSQLKVFEAKEIRMTREMSARLPHMTILLFDAGTKVIDLIVDNVIAETFGKRKRTLEEILVILDPYWKQIKAHLNLSPGGRQNVKHEWSLRDYTCLMVNYDRLKPIWREAKRAARVALNSNEPTRRKRWKEAVAAAYQEENLPSDLIERLAPPEDMPPADLALIHAGRLCVPDVSYSLKILKEKLGYLKKGPRTSPNTSENE